MSFDVDTPNNYKLECCLCGDNFIYSAGYAETRPKYRTCDNCRKWIKKTRKRRTDEVSPLERDQGCASTILILIILCMILIAT